MIIQSYRGAFESVKDVLVQSEDSTVLIALSRRTMHFSTVRPPRPSLLIFVTNGPALLEQPAITTVDNTKHAAKYLFIFISQFQ